MNSAQQLPIPLAGPLARVRGEPLAKLPQDLYIPPEALEVFLESFEGPLDLLLYLIRKNSLDILDIPMAELARQYMLYVEAMRRGRLELAADYLLMAAVLIDIKARLLLPRPASVDPELEVDPRAELMRRLLEYEQMKAAAQALNQLPCAGRDFWPAQAQRDERVLLSLPQLRLQDLQEAWIQVLTRANIQRHHRVEREHLSVREQMTRILRCLQERSLLGFQDLFAAGARVALVVVHFVAVLELVKEGLILVSQEQAYAPLYLTLPGPREEGLVCSGDGLASAAEGVPS